MRWGVWEEWEVWEEWGMWVGIFLVAILVKLSLSLLEYYFLSMILS
ncbi:hypothetical protein [Mastigocoleus testarum]|nr:hypothetical protein [Mastigocoleus testarum]